MTCYYCGRPKANWAPLWNISLCPDCQSVRTTYELKQPDLTEDEIAEKIRSMRTRGHYAFSPDNSGTVRVTPTA